MIVYILFFPTSLMDLSNVLRMKIWKLSEDLLIEKHDKLVEPHKFWEPDSLMVAMNCEVCCFQSEYLQHQLGSIPSPSYIIFHKEVGRKTWSCHLDLLFLSQRASSAFKLMLLCKFYFIFNFFYKRNVRYIIVYITSLCLLAFN